MLGERSIIRGSSGKDVEELANILIKTLYINEIDIEKDYLGNVIYSTKLENAIKRIQKDSGQTVDGIAGKNTIKAIEKIIQNQSKEENETSKFDLGDRVLKKNMHGYDVTQLKNILIDKKFLSGNLVKGASLFDNETEKAVIKFQQSIGIDADGIVETQTVYFLKK